MKFQFFPTVPEIAGLHDTWAPILTAKIYLRYDMLNLISTVSLPICFLLALLVVPAGVVLVEGFRYLLFRQVFADANEFLIS